MAKSRRRRWNWHRGLDGDMRIREQLPRRRQRPCVEGTASNRLETYRARYVEADFNEWMNRSYNRALISSFVAMEFYFGIEMWRDPGTELLPHPPKLCEIAKRRNGVVPFLNLGLARMSKNAELGVLVNTRGTFFGVRSVFPMVGIGEMIYQPIFYCAVSFKNLLFHIICLG
jgi:hypothetical protein